jgi:hypothetical protein
VDVQTETGCLGSGEIQVVVLPWVEGSTGNVLKITKSGDTAVVDWSQGDSARRRDVDSATRNDFSDGHVLSEAPTRKQFRHEGIVGDGIPYFYSIVPFQCAAPG